jgi:5-carboxymethyl-2-hydroxymuconate isomerase
MAHFVLEYSTNISAETLQLQTLFAALHSCAVDSGMFPLKGVRSRAHACSNYRVADGNPEHIFVHLSVLVGAGRSLEDRETVAKALFDVYQQHFASCFEHNGVAMSFEMRELEPVLKYNRNTIEAYL